MKKIVSLLLLTLFLGNLSAQESNQADLIDGNNLVKLSLSSLLFGRYSLEYERVLSKKLSVGLAYSIRPEKALPFKSKVLDIIDDDEVSNLLTDFKSSSRSFTPEFRFYLGKKGYGNGFYIAPYAKFSTFNLQTPYFYDVAIEVGGVPVYDREESIDLEGKVTAFTAGVSFGFNIKVAKGLYLDWRVLGPGYGSAKGDISGNMALNQDEQDGLNEQLSNLQESLEDMPLKIKMDYTVNGQGAAIKVTNSPWANLRSGISLAYRF